jgi:hypothetical protein
MWQAFALTACARGTTGDNFQGFGHPYLTLSRSRGQAPLPERNVVIIFHVPDDEASEYLAITENGIEAGLRKPLPPRMIADVEDL